MAQNCMDTFEKENLTDIAGIEQVFPSYFFPSYFAQSLPVLCHRFDLGRQGSQKPGRRDGSFIGQPNGYVKTFSPRLRRWLTKESDRNVHKVRIISLYIQYRDGVPDEDRRRLYQHGRLTMAEQDAVNALVYLGVKISKVLCIL